MGDEILTGPVGFYDCADDVFGNLVKICQQLLGIFRQAVATVTKGGVIVMTTDSGIQADTFYDLPGIQIPNLGISIQFIEICYAEGKIGV